VTPQLSRSVRAVRPAVSACTLLAGLFATAGAPLWHRRANQPIACTRTTPENATDTAGQEQWVAVRVGL